MGIWLCLYMVLFFILFFLPKIKRVITKVHFSLVECLHSEVILPPTRSSVYASLFLLSQKLDIFSSLFSQILTTAKCSFPRVLDNLHDVKSGISNVLDCKTHSVKSNCFCTTLKENFWKEYTKNILCNE